MLKSIHIILSKVLEKEHLPYDLLLLADPSKQQIDKYLEKGLCYLAKLEDEVVGVIVLYPIDFKIIEIKNIAVKEDMQGKGIGKSLIKHAVKICQHSGYKKLIIGTGNSSIGQMALYQKMGFEIMNIKKNYFTENYPEPIYENGILCKHLIVMEMELDIETID